MADPERFSTPGVEPPHHTDRRYWCRVCRPDADPFVALLGYCYEHAPVPWFARLRARIFGRSKTVYSGRQLQGGDSGE